MKILVVGSGGREHALAWKLLQSSRVNQVFCLPGNGGTAALKNCENLTLDADDFDAIATFTKQKNIALVVIGPELPLAAGLTDTLHEQGIAVFGPTQAGAQIESSKSWAKALMESAGIPTAKAATFTDAASATAYVKEQGAPIVVKADGLAAGKGVTVALTLEAALDAINEVFAGKFGPESQILIEEYLTGQEVSVLALTDGQTIRPLLPAQDHKPIGEGDTGPNTGGMGAYAPVPWVTESLLQQIKSDVLEPTLEALKSRQIDYRGVLYAGLIITPDGQPKVIEFNCRFGDPETQAVLPLLETPLADLLNACAEQKLAQMPKIEWKIGFAACVVMASGGYPGPYQKHYPITGLDEAEATGAVVFHAGTQLQEQTLITSGGRVLAVTAVGKTFEDALQKSYKALSPIQFQESYYRRDIGQRAQPNGT
ncbi:Phosphoribosylamine--glycine ligase [Acaryochloris thomasi RCC1774]|uniref:Phosphoribosylamine--glycine ligase n=1 Tax=Acaryochloris thomasi RCC1774 TaxID=1764569 RepID=A0A2W1JXX7_9CYAN|nr:phosphoribosylamine--glycine ligase [Acaryochloris thomasi]PZD73461.1 Phosphoribosylamine--glycine ligase [Acaryochloris thomasi RCC1774]